MSESDFDSHENLYDIAVVGMSGRFPGAPNVEKFWDNLRDGVESISFFSNDELIAAGVDPVFLNDPRYVKARGVLYDIDLFDAGFFGFSPREAELTNPQHRLMLECAWETLESAGYNPTSYEGSIGVFAGLSSNAYVLNLYAGASLDDPAGSFQFIIGNDKDHAPTRVSYLLNLKGPSVNVQTACSTSLVAVYLACQSLIGRQCDMALAGGVSASDTQKAGYWYVQGGIKSSDGHCRAFDVAAEGTVGGSGLGLVLLKRLSDALADGDHIHAVIKGAAINNDGSGKVGYTAPSVDGQAEVIAEALAVAMVDAESISYVEAHGTGTALGDPIEIAALTQAFRANTNAKKFCAIGSVKTNVGHLDAAAGVTGLIKTILALKHKAIPPSLHFTRPNPQIDFASSPFYVNHQLAEWRRGATPRRAGVSSFGLGGTNAHVILEEAPPQLSSPTSRSKLLLVLSARSEQAVENSVENLARHLRAHPTLNLADVAYTLQVGRRAFKHRRAVVCSDVAGAVAALEAKQFITGAADPQHVTPVAFMFPGGGAQYAGMAAGLYHSEQVFREQVDQCLRLLESSQRDELKKLLYASSNGRVRSAEADQRLQQTSVALPALFVTEYALAKLWISWGVRPDAMIGHSLGEYVAACLAGVFALEDALELVSFRGRLFEQLPEGAMLSVPQSEDFLAPFLNENVSLAAVNGPSQCVVSGTVKAIEELEKTLREAKVDCRRLHIAVAAHSQMVEPILDQFAAFVSRVRLREPQIPYLSNVTGAWTSASQATDPGYWVRHLRHTVRFADGLQELVKDPTRVFLEVGPGNTLSFFARQVMGEENGGVVLPSLPHPNDQRSDEEFVTGALGQLWVAGVPVDWPALYAGEDRRRVPLPTYPFERQRYWVERPAQPLHVTNGSRELSGKRRDLAEWFYIPYWKPATANGRRADAERLRQRSQWLLFLDNFGVGAAIAERLRESQQEIFCVSSGSEFERTGVEDYVINPARREDYEKLIEELRSVQKMPTTIVHLFGVTAKVSGALNDADLTRDHELGFNSLLYLVQSIGEFPRIHLCVVTNDAHAVNGQERISPEKATVIGLSNVIPHEYLNLTCRSVDIVMPSVEGVDNRTLGLLTTELTSQAQEPVVALRGNSRWVPAYEQMRLAAVEPAAAGLRERGVYLITGGLGGLGLALAEYLARAVRARLILIGRSSLPPRDQWDAWLVQHDDGISEKIRQVRTLEELGGEVLLLTADVTDEAQMRDAVEHARDLYGAINGVIHAAGVPFGGMIQLTSPSDAAAVFEPKMKGARVLEAVLEGQELDFILLCSALNAMLGAFGHAAYVSANLFLDAFAHYHSAKSGVPTVSVNWDAWRGTGMAANGSASDDLPRDGQDKFAHGILPHEGMDAFARILASGAPRVIVSTRDFHELLARRDEFEAAESLDRLMKDTPSSKPKHARPQLDVPYVGARDEVESQIAEIWRQLLGIEPIGVQDNFFALGGHSLLAIQLIARTREAFQIELALRDFFLAPTVANLATLVTRQRKTQADQLQQLEAILSEVEQLNGPESNIELLREARGAESR